MLKLSRQHLNFMDFLLIKNNEICARSIISIHHSYNDTGVKGITFEHRTAKGRIVYFFWFSGHRNWTCFQTPALNTNDLIITVTDRDTKLRGHSPENIARLKANLIRL